MSGDTLKKIYEKIPTGVMSAHAPLFVRAMVDNHVYRESWDELERFEAMSAGEKREFQLLKLRAQLEYAYSHVRYYKALFNEFSVDLSTSDIEVAVDRTRHLVGHKKSDVFLVGKIGARIFKGAITLHVDELAGIAAYQYHQTEAGRAELHLVAPGGLSESQEENVMQYIRCRTEGLLDVEIRYVDKVKTSNSGKALWVLIDRGRALSERRRSGSNFSCHGFSQYEDRCLLGWPSCGEASLSPSVCLSVLPSAA